MNNLRQGIVSDRVEALAHSFGISQDQAFARFAHSLLTGISIDEFNPDDIVDGGQDKGIDIITIETDEEEATVYVVQVKNTKSFPSNSLVQMSNGLDWMNNRSRAEIQGLSNLPLRDQIEKYRAIRGKIGPANMRVIVAVITNGISSQVSEEYKQESRAIKDKYDNGTFDSFELESWGCDELIKRLNSIEKNDRRIDADIPIRYDANNPSLLKYFSEGLKAVVCTALASDIARIVNEDESGAIFDVNIRQFLGTRGAVNADIRGSCSHAAVSYLFWFLNNGITIVCDSFDALQDPDHPHVKVKNMQIINGCQTATTLAIAASEGRLAPDTRVLLRIYETSDPALIDRVVLTTNNQNKISTRDLRANDEVQIDMQHGFEKYGYLYERKTHQYDNDSSIDHACVVVNEIVGQSYLAIVLKRPSDARRRKYKIWVDDYNKVFGGQSIEPHVLSTLLFRATESWLRSSGRMQDSDDLVRKLAKNGSFHIARIASFLWRKSDKWADAESDLKNQIAQVQSNPGILGSFVDLSLELLANILRSNKQFGEDVVETSLKSAALDMEIDRQLYQQDKGNTSS